MKKLISLIAGISMAVSSFAQDSSSLSYPESVTSDGKFLYVTNVGKTFEPTAKDGDGFISKVSLDGKTITRFITDAKLNAPKGIGIVRGVLYVTDIDRIVGIQLHTGTKVVDINLSVTGASFV